MGQSAPFKKSDNLQLVSQILKLAIKSFLSFH